MSALSHLLRCGLVMLSGLAGLGLLAGLTPATAQAQQRATITVVVADRVGFDADERFQLQYGLEQIVRDFDEFELLTQMDREGMLSTRERLDLPTCGLDVDCYAAILRPLDVDVAVVVEAELEPDADDFVAYTTGLDLHSRQILSEHRGNFPDSGDTLFLLAPMFETMQPLVGLGARPRTPTRPPPSRRDPQTTLPPPPPTEPGTNVLSTALMAGGGALVVTGVVFWMLADDTLEDIQAEPHERADLLALQDTGSGQQSVGNIAFLAGLAVLATGIVFELTGVGQPSRRGTMGFDDDWVRLEISPGSTPSVGIGLDF